MPETKYQELQRLRREKRAAQGLADRKRRVAYQRLVDHLNRTGQRLRKQRPDLATMPTAQYRVYRQRKKARQVMRRRLMRSRMGPRRK